MMRICCRSALYGVAGSVQHFELAGWPVIHMSRVLHYNDCLPMRFWSLLRWLNALEFHFLEYAVHWRFPYHDVNRSDDPHGRLHPHAVFLPNWAKGIKEAKDNYPPPNATKLRQTAR
jgi:hypothetical protein